MYLTQEQIQLYLEMMNISEEDLLNYTGFIDQQGDYCQFESKPRNFMLIICFGVIFCLSIIGNSTVIVTIIQQKWMRTVTNFYLLNLAISDMLLSLICMPPTLIGLLLECFLFGDTMCKVIAYLQPVTVTASAYTLAAIAFERYYAICRPLHSHMRHTVAHAALIIVFVWAVAFIVNICPLLVYHAVELAPGRYNCRPKSFWRGPKVVIHYFVILLVIFLIPLIVMTVLYGVMIRTLRSGLQQDKKAINVAKMYASAESINGVDNDCTTSFILPERSISLETPEQRRKRMFGRMSSLGRLYHSMRIIIFRIKKPSPEQQKIPEIKIEPSSRRASPMLSVNPGSIIRKLTKAKKSRQEGVGDIATKKTSRISFHPRDRSESVYSEATSGGSSRGSVKLRSTHTLQAIENKKRVIRMLVVVVVIFFICWTPTYGYWSLIYIGTLLGFNIFDSTAFTFITIMAYLSSCTNPIVYCFLNKKFRQAFMLAFGCRQELPPQKHSANQQSQSNYASRASNLATPQWRHRQRAPSNPNISPRSSQSHNNLQIIPGNKKRQSVAATGV